VRAVRRLQGRILGLFHRGDSASGGARTTQMDAVGLLAPDQVDAGVTLDVPGPRPNPAFTPLRANEFRHRSRRAARQP